MKKDGNFDTMHRPSMQSCKGAPVSAPGKTACARFLPAVFPSFFKHPARLMLLYFTQSVLSRYKLQHFHVVSEVYLGL